MILQHPHAAAVTAYRPLSALLPAHWQHGTVIAQDSTAIHYTRTGSGTPGAKPALLLLHGIQVDGLMWLRTAQALEADYDVIMPDQRGHGSTGGVANTLSASLMVSDMVTLITALGLETPFVIGHSMGAEIAGRLAAAVSLRGVVLVDPALRNFYAGGIGQALNNSAEPPLWLQAIYETMQKLRSQSHAERLHTGLRLLPPGAPLWDEADYVSFIEGQAQFDPTFLRLASALGYLFEDPQTIAQITCPALLLTARPMMPGADTAHGQAVYLDNLRHGEHVHLEDSGHFIPFDAFERFVAVLRGFLAGAETAH